MEHALAEGEGYESIADWRAGHTRFWTSEAMRAELGDDFELSDSSLVVLEQFVLAPLSDDSPGHAWQVGLVNDSDRPALILRAYEPSDAAATLAVFTEAITQTAAAHYTAEQIDAWARPGRRDLAVWDRAMSERASVVAIQDSQVVGFSDVDQSGYIDMLFVSPKRLRRGIARTLLAFIEQKARSAGTTELTADVSLAARAFFERSGFEVVREKRPTKYGIELINYRMRKALSYPSARAR